jgi:hypothetical protein
MRHVRPSRYPFIPLSALARAAVGASSVGQEPSRE